MAAPTLGDIIQAVGSPVEWGVTPIGTSLASAKPTADITGLTGSGYVSLGSEYFDIGNNFSTSYYTCPVTGYYHVKFGIHIFPVGGGYIIAFFGVVDDGSTINYVRGTRSSGAFYGFVSSNGSKLVHLTAGDKLYLWFYLTVSAGKTATIEAGSTFMTIHLVSKG